MNNFPNPTILIASICLVAALTRCGPDNCTAGDDACILAHLRISDGNGNNVALTKVPGSAIQPMSRTTAAGGPASAPSGVSGNATAVPTISGMPQTLTFLDWYNIWTMTVTFTDPCGAQPGGCFSVHHGATRSSTAAWYATSPVADGQTQGQWTFKMSFDYNSSATDQFTIDFVAFSQCAKNGQTAIQALISDDSVAISSLSEISAQVDAGNSSSNGSTSFSCPSPTVASALVSGGCCTTGICPNACSDSTESWYEVDGKEYGPCAASNTTCLEAAAESAVNFCTGQ